MTCAASPTLVRVFKMKVNDVCCRPDKPVEAHVAVALVERQVLRVTLESVTDTSTLHRRGAEHAHRPSGPQVVGDAS